MCRVCNAEIVWGGVSVPNLPPHTAHPPPRASVGVNGRESLWRRAIPVQCRLGISLETDDEVVDSEPFVTQSRGHCRREAGERDPRRLAGSVTRIHAYVSR